MTIRINVNLRPSQQGISLVELMIALALGVFLTAGAIQTYVMSRQTYGMQRAVASIQENGRMAQEFLGFDIRNAGNTGCGSNSMTGDIDGSEDPAHGSQYCSTAINTLYDDAGDLEFDFGKPVFGIDNADGSSTPGSGTFNTAGGLNPAPLAGTDVLVIRGSIDSGVVLTGDNNGDANMAVTVTTVDGNGCFSGICPNDILVVTDCAKAKIFQANALQQNGELIVHNNSGLAQCSAWGGNGQNKPTFAAGSKVMKMTSRFYYVANNADGIPSLYTTITPGTATELLTGVENLQLEFGVGQNNNDGNGYVIDEFKTANNVTEGEWDSWDDDDRVVVAVRYSILLRGEDNVLDEPQRYRYNSADFVGGVAGTAASTASDRRLRQTFTSTTSIRNMLP